MNSNDIDLDRIVNYEHEYSSVIKQHKITGDRLTGLCPFHPDHNASFSADLKTGMYTCFSCGEAGNFITFEAKMSGTETKEAYKAILERYGVKSEPKIPESYTVAEYAAAKHLPEDWLKDTFRLGTGKDRDGKPWIRIPYYTMQGSERLHRKRFPAGVTPRFKWKAGSAGKLLMYGEWGIPRFLEAEDKSVILVEGESDTQTLWYLGLRALGIPGASTFRPEWTERLKGFERIYMHIEPDQGGETFRIQMSQKLKDGGFAGRLFQFSCSDVDGIKDPSDLFVRLGKEEAARRIRELIASPKEIDLGKLGEEMPSAIEDAPLKLRQPEGWIYSERGISRINEKTSQPTLVCRTPLIITKRLHSIETGDEKIELAFKRDGEWHTMVQSRSLVFQARSITALADQGLTITSENAKMVVRYLEKLEAENIDVIEKSDSASTFGWHGTERFLPGCADNLVLDIEPSLRGWASAYCQSGTLDGWVDMIRPHRERDRFRFIVSAAFTAPILRIVRQRIFFVYNWGGSRGGKSAALKAALSAWGDPERLMVNFNATQVALERMAGFYCDLPLGIDERQLAGNNQGTLEKIVYMLASGTGRIRGTKNGGLQAMQTWRTVILATGEEPITTDTSQTGVSTRVLEIYGAPFDSEQDAGLMHMSTSENYGWAGEEFIRRIMECGEENIRNRFADMYDFVYKLSEGKNGSHAAGIAAVATADALVSEWIFGSGREAADERARIMAANIVVKNAQNASSDVNESAAEFIEDWININGQAFQPDGYGQKVGWIDDIQNCACVFPAALKKALNDAGFNPRKTFKYLSERGAIDSRVEGDKFRYAINVGHQGKVVRVIRVRMGILKDLTGGNHSKDVWLETDEKKWETGHEDNENVSEYSDDCPF